MAVRKYLLFELPSCWHQPDPEPRNVHRFWPWKQVFYVFSSIYQREYKFIPISKFIPFFPLDSLIFRLDSVRLSNCKNLPGKRVRGNVFGKFELLNCCFLNFNNSFFLFIDNEDYGKYYEIFFLDFINFYCVYLNLMVLINFFVNNRFLLSIIFYLVTSF